MITIFRRLNDDNNFVDFPSPQSNTTPQTATEDPANDAFSFRFSFLYAYDGVIPPSSTVRPNEYYEDTFLEIEV